MIELSVLFLGPSRDLVESESILLTLSDGATVADLRSALTGRFPRLSAAMSSIRFAVNETFATDATPLSSGDEVALIPPVSGG